MIVSLSAVNTTVQERWESARIHPFTQQQLGQVVAISPADSSLQEGDPDRLARKRKNDREYRVRCKVKMNIISNHHISPPYCWGECGIFN